MGEKSCENCRKYNEDDPDATPCLHSNCGPSNDYEDWQPRSEVEKPSKKIVFDDELRRAEAMEKGEDR